MARNNKSLSEQKGNLTIEQQETIQQTEKEMYNLKPIQKTPPQWLDANAKKEYNRILPLLQELPIADLDLALVASYCQTYSMYCEAIRKLNKHGLVTETERGTKLSSYYTVQRDCINALNTISNKLGLNIDSRMKIISHKKEDKKDDDPFKDLMANNG